MMEKIPWWLADFFEWIAEKLGVNMQGSPKDRPETEGRTDD